MTSASDRIRTRASRAIARDLRPDPIILGNHRKIACIALGAIFASALLDIFLLGLELNGAWERNLIHALTAISLLLILVAAGAGFHLLRERVAIAQQESLKLEQLRRNRVAAEAENIVKARHFANVGHEIRSPLNAIYGYAQLIEQGGDVRPREAARIIRRCAEHITSLVESLLDISRAANGVLRVRSEAMHLPDFIEQIVWMMRPAAQAKGLEFIYEEASPLPEFVRTDPSRLRQALINLLSNAIKFTEHGSVTLRASYRSQIATFEIIDTGPGIAADDQDAIFEPYVSVERPEGCRSSGIGLGLPIARAILDMLGGNLELESAAGKGSSFKVTLMLGQVAEIQLAQSTSRRICGYEGHQRTVLVVDDDPDQRSFLDQFLRSCGFDVTSVADGEAALAETARRSFDLAILDITLPGISGWEAAIRIREHLKRDLIIVMASANAQEFHHPEHDKPVHDHFFVKPYRLDQMAETIGALLHLNWKWEAIGAASPASEQALPEAVRVHITRLQELIRIGHVRAIETEIDFLAKASPTQSKLVEALYAALDEFDLARMKNLLEQK